MIENKIMSLPEAQIWRKNLAAEEKELSFTNGCFDIMHAGHANYLQRASEQGDFLVVGVNSDESLRKLKGPTRPIVQERYRAEMLAALACVDAVVIFNTDNSCSLIEALRPNIYVKGGDYTLDTINQDEADLIRKYRIDARFLSFVEGLSTSKIVEKIIEDFKAGLK
ncbi:MAG: adenylyltransferase/cytidyltransferase family protein [Lentisphaeria bacterium]|nr:adenylyltransferase/cytidyltransferase family protein [Lentisphaeria bacterium]